MFKRICLLLVTISIMCAHQPLFAELSSKAKKAEKLIAAGNIIGAKAIYTELMAKDKVKNADLVKEGREGYAKLQMTLGKEALKYKRFDESEIILKEIM